MKFLTILIAITFATHISGFGQDKTFNFKAQVLSYNKPLKDATVEIYDGGDLILETKTSGSGKINFDLKSERQYMVEISMENLRMKTIWINTKHTQDITSKIPTFSFFVHLKKEKITPYDELSEIPVTLIKYQPKKEEFYMDKTYENAVEAKKKYIKENDILIR